MSVGAWAVKDLPGTRRVAAEGGGGGGGGGSAYDQGAALARMMGGAGGGGGGGGPRTAHPSGGAVIGGGGGGGDWGSPSLIDFSRAYGGDGGAGSAAGLDFKAGGGGGGGAAAGGSSLSPSTSTFNFSSPGPVNVDTAVNPLEKNAYDRWADYDKNLAAGTNEEITRELQRARDDLSKGMEREGQAAIGRGADPGLFRTRMLESGKRDIHSLQGRLADVALGRRAEGLAGLTTSANRAAEGQRALHLGTTAARLAEQRYALDAADQQARLREAPYKRMYDMLDIVTRNAGLFGGGGSGYLGY